MELVSPYIIAAGLGWVVAQASKYVVASFKLGKLASYRQLYLSGRMPSAHSATTVALLVTVAAFNGVHSAIFGVAFLLTLIVLYDAMMVRRSSGEQGVALTAFMKEQKSKVPYPRVAMGHTPMEVAVGSLLGLVVGLAVVTFYNGLV